MCDSLQDGYAKHLKHPHYGYPLRIPEPISLLPQQYQESGLEIGDVGIVDDDGQFDVLFSICKQSDHPLHDRRGVPENFQPVECGEVKSIQGAISPGSLCSAGIKQTFQNESSRPVEYKFKTSTPSGAVLILPDGATSTSLLLTDQFREAAIRNAHHWCAFADKFYGTEYPHRTLYLLTGVYKASSWSLGSFNHVTDPTGEILAKRDDENLRSYILHFSFLGDRRNCLASEVGGIDNQTVFIAGFRITVCSWLLDPVIEKITRPENVWSMLIHQIMACLRRLRGSSRGQKQSSTICTENKSKLSQPVHPSDIINDVLLNENPEAKIAITHDDQWMDMMKEGMEDADLCDELRLKTFLTKHYTISVDSRSKNTVALLRREGECNTPTVPVDTLSEPDSVASESLASDYEEFFPSESPPPSPQLETMLPATADATPSVPPTLSLDDPQTVITYIRAENIPCGGKRIPAGFYVLVEFGDVRRRTQNKSIRLNDTCIEWEDEISLPSKTFDIARFTIYASFEFDPILGNGETLYTAEVHVKELVGGTHLIMLSSEEFGTVAHAPSLLITSAKWYSDYLTVTSGGSDNNLELDENSDLARETELGQRALLHYLNEYKRVDLDNATQHFENAWHFCNSSHRCRAVVLVNLAMAKFMSYKIDPTSSNLDELILLYRQALELRCPGHRDRPATVLQLAQALLYRYEREGSKESAASEIDELMDELRDLSRDSHERRAADLILETLQRCRIVNSGSLAQLNDLVEQLNCGAAVPPDGYFDRPQRLVNLNTALWRYHEKHGKPEGLDGLVEANKQALQLLPQGHPERLPLVGVHVDVLWKLYEIHNDFKYLDELDALDGEAVVSMLGQYLAGRDDHIERALSPSDEKLLIRWAKIILARSSAQEALSAAAKSNVPRFLVYRAICDTLESVGRLTEAIECYRKMKNDFPEGGETHDERVQWERDFRGRCAVKLERLGDMARDFEKHKDAIVHYSSALSLDPTNANEILLKRSNEVIVLDPSSYDGYEGKYTALHRMGRHMEASEILRTMSALEQSPGRQIRGAGKRVLTRTRSTPAHRGPPPPYDSQACNVVIFGETGVGKSSVINLIAGSKLANTSPDAGACTFTSRAYTVVLQSNRPFCIWDTVGLNEAEISHDDYLRAVKQAYTLIKELERSGGVHLLLLCMRGRITKSVQQNYKLFSRVLCEREVPLCIVVTNLENEPNMEEWWTTNEGVFEKYDISSQGHACITAYPGIGNVFLERYKESGERIRKLLLESETRLSSKGWQKDVQTWLTDLLEKMVKMIPPRLRRSGLPIDDDLAEKLVKECGFSKRDAINIARSIGEKVLGSDED